MNWIQNVHPKEGFLHKQLGIPMSHGIPEQLENKILAAKIGSHVYGRTVTPLLKHRVQFAVNVRK